MSDLERRLRASAEDARAAARAAVDVEAQLPATLERARATSSSPEIRDNPSMRSRRVAVAMAAAALVGLLGGGLLILRGDDEDRVLTSPTETAAVGTVDTVDTVDTVSTVPSTEPLTPATTAPTTTTVSSPTTTIGPPPPTAPGGAVSYLSPPPTLALRPLGTAELSARSSGEMWVDVAIGDRGVVVNESWAGHVTVVGFDGSQREVPVDGTIGPIVYGPGEVLYGLWQGDSIDDFAMVAVALDGDRTGLTVASTPLPIVTYQELPTMAFGHGRDGIIDRVRDVNATVSSYVGIDGESTTWTGPDPVLLTDSNIDDADRLPNTSVSASNGRAWQLDIEASPTRAHPFIGSSPAAPSNDGVAVYWTYVGPDARPDVDFGQPTMPVIAALHVDGSVEWRSIPDGWQLVASDLWGTVLAKLDGTRLELALADFTASGDDGDGGPDIPVGELPFDREQSLATIVEYFGHIERGEWIEAARMLDDGAISLEERPDLQRLAPATFTLADIATALERWCRDGCDTEAPTADDLTLVRVYGLTRGDERIDVAWFEGQYSISGLPFRIEPAG